MSKPSVNPSVSLRLTAPLIRGAFKYNTEGLSSDETTEEEGQDSLGVLAEGVAAAGDAPVVHEPALEHGVRLGDVVH